MRTCLFWEARPRQWINDFLMFRMNFVPSFSRNWRPEKTLEEERTKNVLPLNVWIHFSSDGESYPRRMELLNPNMVSMPVPVAAWSKA